MKIKNDASVLLEANRPLPRRLAKCVKATVDKVLEPKMILLDCDGWFSCVIREFDKVHGVEFAEDDEDY